MLWELITVIQVIEDGKSWKHSATAYRIEAQRQSHHTRRRNQNASKSLTVSLSPCVLLLSAGKKKAEQFSRTCPLSSVTRVEMHPWTHQCMTSWASSNTPWEDGKVGCMRITRGRKRENWFPMQFLWPWTRAFLNQWMPWRLNFRERASQQHLGRGWLDFELSGEKRKRPAGRG